VKNKLLHKFKRKISSLSYFINRLYRKISTTKPSFMILSVVAIAFSIFLFGGGIYNLVNRPLPSKYVYKPRQAYLMFLVGLILLILAYAFIEITIESKT